MLIWHWICLRKPPRDFCIVSGYVSLFVFWYKCFLHSYVDLGGKTERPSYKRNLTWKTSMKLNHHFNFSFSISFHFNSIISLRIALFWSLNWSIYHRNKFINICFSFLKIMIYFIGLTLEGRRRIWFCLSFEIGLHVCFTSIHCLFIFFILYFHFVVIH
jgi:hypothetical protein